MAEHSDPHVRAIGLRGLANSARMGERRGLLRGMRFAVAAGTERRTIYDAKHSSRLPGDLVRAEGDPASTDGAVNEAYDGLGATYDLYAKVFDRNSVDGHGLRLDASVHYNDNNAYWDGQQMIFGDGDGVVFLGFTGAIDVIGHELTHGVTQYSANLDYHNQSGALNESFSDVFGTLVKQFKLNQTVDGADWLIGNGILGPTVNGTALRSMKDPGTAYDDPRLGGKDPQPGHMKDYVQLPDDYPNDWGGVHINSGIPNRAFCLLATNLGGHAWEDAGHIWYAALLRLSSAATFQDCANVCLEVAGTLFGTDSQQQQAVQGAWATVGVAASRPAQPLARSTELATAAQDAAALKVKLKNAARELNSIVDRL